MTKSIFGAGEKLKTNYKDPVQRYELAERMVFDKLPQWKKNVIIACKETGEESRIFDEYSQDIIRLAECDSTEFNGDLPKAPLSKAARQAALNAKTVDLVALNRKTAGQVAVEPLVIFGGAK